VLGSTNIVVTANNKTIGFITELNIKCSVNNLVVFAEVITTDLERNSATNYYIVEKINMIGKKTFINLIEIDYTPSFSSSEKVIDIRDIKKKIIIK